jgi:hypothetical protein
MEKDKEGYLKKPVFQRLTVKISQEGAREK